MREYATKIRKIQGELGISVASFPNLGIAWARDVFIFRTHEFAADYLCYRPMVNGRQTEFIMSASINLLHMIIGFDLTLI